MEIVQAQWDLKGPDPFPRPNETLRFVLHRDKCLLDLPQGRFITMATLRWSLPCRLLGDADVGAEWLHGAVATTPSLRRRKRLESWYLKFERYKLKSGSNCDFTICTAYSRLLDYHHFVKSYQMNEQWPFFLSFLELTDHISYLF